MHGLRSPGAARTRRPRQRTALRRGRADARGRQVDEDYDSDDKAMVSALAPLMMRKKTRDDLVESGYNRYAYNDDQVLPLPRGASRTAQNMYFQYDFLVSKYAF